MRATAARVRATEALRVQARCPPSLGCGAVEDRSSDRCNSAFVAWECIQRDERRQQSAASAPLDEAVKLIFTCKACWGSSG
eukprot:3412780-Pleurochrysis_carterae.AAC.2